ncbi:MAG: uroporphyrinogen decarboxylase family protein [Kiritimatiellae bacterium]|nr:uroporphyrinogen decarboxylase family protein [Kiritimatiellia bacterium]
MTASSEDFACDPRDPAILKHNQEVREVWEAYKADRPVRVPLIFSDARTVYADEHNIDYCTYYNDPEEMLRLQLQWAKRERELPFGDTVLGELPERWGIGPDFHPVLIPACFGCEVVFRPDAVPAHHGLNLSRRECDDLAMPDLRRSGLLPRLREIRAHFDRRYAGDYRFMGRPVVYNFPGMWMGIFGGGTFSLALDIRGGDIMADMYEAPDFVHRFLRRLADWQISLFRGLYAENGLDFAIDRPGGAGFGPTDHGIDMLSVEVYEKFLVPLIHDLNERYRKTAHTDLHHCGRGAHLFPTIKRHFSTTHIHGLTYPLNDVARVRKDIGYETWITAIVAASILADGPPDRIRKAVKDFLTPEVKGQGRLAVWVSAESRHVPPEHYLALYEAVKEYGRYG